MEFDPYQVASCRILVPYEILLGTIFIFLSVEKIAKSRWKYVTQGTGFSKVPKHLGRISGYIILFVSSKRRRLEARHFDVVLILIPFTTSEKTTFTE